ncbi:MAG: DUF5131 family protein [Syntrophobacteraceae bacterium]
MEFRRRMPEVIGREASTEKISKLEKSQLLKHEEIISKNLTAFYEVGTALITIRDGRLYRETHTTFEVYCRERWGMSRFYAHRLIGASEVVVDLLPIGNISSAEPEIPLPANESQARPLSKVPSKKRREVWREAVETAPESGLTTAHVEKTVQEHQEPAQPKESVSVFNRTNSSIKWASWTWNPVTGCEHGCKYCYARDIANRFNPKGFEPTFHPERLKAPKNTPFPTKINTIGDKSVFVCSMADLFGEWVEQEWINRVLDAVRESPQWNYIFLTKNPKRLIEIKWPDNAWVGATVDTQARVKPTEQAFAKVTAKIKFISCEPLLGPLKFSRLDLFQWVIIGARSRSSGAPEMQPEREWVRSLVHQAMNAGCSIFCKPNLNPLLFNEYPLQEV